MAKEEMENIFTEDLLKNRQIYIDEIDYQSAERLTKMILWLNTKSESETTLYINCDGGSVEAGLKMYDIIKYSKSSVIGIVCQRANSMASTVLQACKERRAMRHSTFSLHMIELKVYGEIDILEKKVRKELEKTNKSQKEIWKLFCERGVNFKEIKKLCRQKKILSAQEALEIGLIDEII